MKVWPIASLFVFHSRWALKLQRQPSTLSSSTFSSSSSSSSSSSKGIVEAGHVYFVATPIGNLGDISLRAIEVLKSVNVLCAEDTRHTMKLLNHFNISFGENRLKLLATHEHNWKVQSKRILDLIQAGNSVAVVTDAGTPGISDPGAELAEILTRHKIPLHPVPGPSAVAAALSVSGLPASPFTFFGFLPAKGRERRLAVEAVHQTEHTVVLYEAPHRLLKTLSELCGIDDDVQGKRRSGGSLASPLLSSRWVVCCRELTKVHEEIFRGSLLESFHHFGGDVGDERKNQNLESQNQEEDSDGSHSHDPRNRDVSPETRHRHRKEKIDTDEAVRGEFTLVLGPISLSNDNSNYNDTRDRSTEDSLSSDTGTTTTSEAEIAATLEQLMRDGVKRSEAVRMVVEMTGARKSRVYRAALQLQDWT